jgi:hypothetical protein
MIRVASKLLNQSKLPEEAFKFDEASRRSFQVISNLLGSFQVSESFVNASRFRKASKEAFKFQEAFRGFSNPKSFLNELPIFFNLFEEALKLFEKAGQSSEA